MPFKICIIEDDPSIAALYEFKLRLEGYAVLVAHSAVVGLKIIEKTQPDLILLDLKMPHMNGDEMLEKLRAKPWGSSVRVIILTNMSRNEAPHNLRFLRVDRYVVKAHHTPAQIVQVANEILGNFADKKKL